MTKPACPLKNTTSKKLFLLCCEKKPIQHLYCLTSLQHPGLGNTHTDSKYACLHAYVFDSFLLMVFDKFTQLGKRSRHPQSTKLLQGGEAGGKNRKELPSTAMKDKGIGERHSSKAGSAPRAACSISHFCFHAGLLQEQGNAPYYPDSPQRSHLLTPVARVRRQHSLAQGSPSHRPASLGQVKALTLDSKRQTFGRPGHSTV